MKSVMQRLTERTVVTPAGCWEWRGFRDPDGYGAVFDGTTTDSGSRRRVRTHRAGWIVLRGPIPEGLVTDHLCRNRACWNPEHIELVEPGENVRRGNSPSSIAREKTHCAEGHPLHPHGDRRRCPICNLKWNRRGDAKACPICGGPFRSSVGGKGTSQTCSRHCGAVLRERNKRAA